MATEVVAIGIGTVEIIERSDLLTGRAPAVAIKSPNWKKKAANCRGELS